MIPELQSSLAQLAWNLIYPSHSEKMSNVMQGAESVLLREPIGSQNLANLSTFVSETGVSQSED